MDYFFYKDVLGGYLLISYIIYTLVIFIKRFIFKKKSAQIIKIPVAKNTIQYILLIILTYIVSIPVLTYYFSKGLRLIYIQFVDRKDSFLIRKGFFNDDYDSRFITYFVFFYFLLIIKLIVSHTTRYTIRKDNFIVVSWFIFMAFLGAWGKGNDIRTYSHEIITELFFLFMYFVVRNKVIKDL